MRPAAALCLSLPLIATCGGPPARASLRAPFGEVSAADEASARRVADAVRQLLPALRERIPAAAEGPLRVEVQGERLEVDGRLAPPQILGKHLAGGPGLGRVLLVQAWQPEILAHELVHALLAGPGWQPLPPALEEGLADALAVEVLEESWPEQAEVILERRRRWLDRTLESDLGPPETLALPAATLRGHSAEEEQARVVGFLLARTLLDGSGGLERLHRAVAESGGDRGAVAGAVLAATEGSWRAQAARLRRRGR